MANVLAALIKGNYGSYWENLKFNSYHTKTAEPIITQLCMGNYTVEPPDWSAQSQLVVMLHHYYTVYTGYPFASA